MDIDKMLELVHAKVNDDARRTGVMELGTLRTALSRCGHKLPVVIDTGGSPSALSSYRGYYDRLAIEVDGSNAETKIVGEVGTTHIPGFGSLEHGRDEVSIKTPCTVGDMLAALDLADGETFEGYKGGAYLMDEHTFLHVAQYGDCGRYVSGLRDIGGRVVIETAEEVW